MASGRKLLVDCDAGSDDAMALLLAFHQTDVDVIGITAVNGNALVDDVTRNILQVLRFVNRLEIPVFRGSQVTLAGHPCAANGFHGKDGMGDSLDPNLVDTGLVKTEPAASAIVRLVNEHKGEVSLVATGPLTNIAMALHLDPQLGSKLKGFYVMGGNTTGAGNVTATAEFNFYADPEAARMVLEQLRIPTTLIPFEICIQNAISWEDYDGMVNSSGPGATFMRQITRVYAENGRNGNYPNFPAFDELAMAVFLDSRIATEIKDVYATVCTDSGLCRGQTVIDWKGKFNRPANLRLVSEIDLNMYVHMLKAMLASCIS